METQIPIANAIEVYGERNFRYSKTIRGPRASLFLMRAGAYGDNRVYVWARSFEAALELAAEYWTEHAPGVFSEPDYADSARELGLDWAAISTGPGAEGEDALEARLRVCEHAETDHTYTESGWLLSYEWWGDEITDPLTWYAIRMRSDLEVIGEL